MMIAVASQEEEGRRRWTDRRIDRRVDIRRIDTFIYKWIDHA